MNHVIQNLIESSRKSESLEQENARLRAENLMQRAEIMRLHAALDRASPSIIVQPLRIVQNGPTCGCQH